MKENISVDKAIKRGHLIVNVPVFIAILGIPVLAIYFSYLKIIPNWSILVSFVVGFVVSWIIWSFMITKWRLWAFENVRNVHELKKRAIQEKLIWEDGNWFEKTEIRTSNDKHKLKELNKKFLKKDIHKEDFSIPMSTTIYYSKTTNLIEMGSMLFCFGFGIYLILASDSYIIGTLFTIIGGSVAIKEYKQATNTEPQIIIDNKGIKTIQTDFKSWKEIKGEEIIYEISGKRSTTFLIYEYNEGYEKIKTDDFNITPKKLENLIKTYRIRYEKNYR
ncbi:hypothetical protein [Namhaeicola litoreus]|uniref:YcxB-like protein n=1 Tax=Namhaeicola litoreus TaxID=1052145 RepID=A0ABW3Y5P7_9FLAO